MHSLKQGIFGIEKVFNTALAYSNGILFAATVSGPGTGPRLLTSMNADLTLRWQVELASRDQNIKFYYNTIPWVANGRVFVQANDGLHCFDAHATEATELWHRPSIRIPLRSAR